MSIQSEINRISGNVSDALDAIEAKGVTIPTGANSDDLANLIGQISGGGGGTGGTITQDQDGYLVLSPDGGGGGGGGSSSWELLDTREEQVTTASTAAGQVVQVEVPYDDQKILWVAIRDKAGYRTGYFYGSDTLFIAGGAYALCRSVSGAAAEKGFWQASAGDMNGGVYARGGLTVNASTGMATVYIRRKYNSTYCGTIDGTFKINIYALSYPSGVLPLLEEGGE